MNTDEDDGDEEDTNFTDSKSKSLEFYRRDAESAEEETPLEDSPISEINIGRLPIQALVICRKLKILDMHIAKQRRKNRFASVIMPHTARVIRITIPKPGPITQKDFRRRLYRYPVAFDRSTIGAIYRLS